MVSAGSYDVCRAVMEEVGEILLLILERVERNFRRRRCGRNIGIEGHDVGTLPVESMRAASSRMGEYGAIAMRRWECHQGRRTRVLKRRCVDVVVFGEGVAVCWLPWETGAAKAEAKGRGGRCRASGSGDAKGWWRC